MEIKQGDKVRVSKDAPEMYFFGCNHDNSVCEVILVDRDNAVITQIKNGSFAIPTKYLIKVDAEAKEPKYKVGDKVRYIGDVSTYKGKAFVIDGEVFFNNHYNEWQTRSIKPFAWDGLSVCNVPLTDLKPYTEPTAPTIKVGDRVRCKNPIRLANSTDDDFIGTVTDAENGWFRVHLNNGAIFQTYHESDLELVQPKEQTETDKKPKVGSIKIPVEVDLTDSYWGAYAADLAKEIALKVANKYNDPEQAAEYAVRVAKAVVENLKKK